METGGQSNTQIIDSKTWQHAITRLLTTFNQRVAGSSPTRLINISNNLGWLSDHPFIVFDQLLTIFPVARQGFYCPPLSQFRRVGVPPGRLQVAVPQDFGNGKSIRAGISYPGSSRGRPLLL